MCRSKADGGHRCSSPSHSPASRKLGRVAFRLYGTSTAVTREAVSHLNPEYVNGSVADRRRIGRAAIDQEIRELAAAKTNQEPAPGDTTDAEDRTFTKRGTGSLSLHDLGIEDNIEPVGDGLVDPRPPKNENGYRFPNFHEKGELVNPHLGWKREQQAEFDGMRTFDPSQFVRMYGTNSLVLEVLGKYKDAPLPAVIAWAPSGEDLSEAQAAHRVRSPHLSAAEYSEVNRFLFDFPNDPETDPAALRNLFDKGGDSTVIEEIAANPSTPVDILETLAEREHPHGFDFALASNPSTPAALHSKIEARIIATRAKWEKWRLKTRDTDDDDDDDDEGYSGD